MARAGNNHKGGRPIGTKAAHTYEAQEAKRRIVEKVSERVDELVEALFIKAIQRDLTGVIQNVDVPAIKELLDRAYGKPQQSVEMTGKDGKELFEPSAKLKLLAKELNELHRKGARSGK